jgi:hypothetical protein
MNFFSFPFSFLYPNLEFHPNHFKNKICHVSLYFYQFWSLFFWLLFVFLFMIF